MPRRRPHQCWILLVANNVSTQCRRSCTQSLNYRVTIEAKRYPSGRGHDHQTDAILCSACRMRTPCPAQDRCHSHDTRNLPRQNQASATYPSTSQSHRILPFWPMSYCLVRHCFDANHQEAVRTQFQQAHGYARRLLHISVRNLKQR